MRLLSLWAEPNTSFRLSSLLPMQAQRTKDTLPIVQSAEHAVLLSGTPMISRPKEMLTQLSALVPEAKLKLKDFGERYCLSNNPKAYSKYDGEEWTGLYLQQHIAGNGKGVPFLRNGVPFSYSVSCRARCIFVPHHTQY